jgi:hypothetical protein
VAWESPLLSPSQSPSTGPLRGANHTYHGAPLARRESHLPWGPALRASPWHRLHRPSAAPPLAGERLGVAR